MLGKYSDGFYVYHLIWARGWSYSETVLAKELHSSILGTVIVDGISFGATFVVSKVSYDYFERQFLRLKRKFEYDSERISRQHASSEMLA